MAKLQLPMLKKGDVALPSLPPLPSLINPFESKGQEQDKIEDDELLENLELPCLPSLQRPSVFNMEPPDLNLNSDELPYSI